MAVHKARPKKRNPAPKKRPTAPARRPPEIDHGSDLIAYPTNKVIGIIDKAQDAEAAVHDLRRAGFTRDKIRVLTGEQGAHRIDPTGDRHGLLAQILRSTQRVLGRYEIPHATRHEEEMLAGHFGIGITVEDKEDREKALRILESHHGHFINFYGPLVMEMLKP